MTDSPFTAIEAAAHEGAFGDNGQPLPSDAQRRAGNYRMGRVTLHGLRIAIEQPRGTTRTGTDRDGKSWSCRLAAHYGYFVGTKGADGDGVDVFIAPNPAAEVAYIVNQNVGGRFDEHKVVLGAVDEDHARHIYRASYARDWRGLASIVTATIPQLKHWLRHGNKRRALTADQLHPQGTESMNRVFWNRDAQPEGLSLDQVLYHVRISDGGDNLLLDAVSMADILEDSEGVIALDAMVLPVNMLARKMAVLKTIMERAGGSVKPLEVQISDAFKQRGITNVAAVFELSDGQTVTIYFHNPDTTPNRLMPTDELVSWKWLLNKKDITIVVAPERGADLNPREVARRIMRLAEKNSAAFQRVNAKRAERMATIQSLKGEVAELETELSKAQRELEAELILAEERAANPAPAPEPEGEDESATDQYGQNTRDLNRRADEWERRIEEMSAKDAVRLAFAAGLTNAKATNAAELLLQEHPDDLDAAFAKLGGQSAAEIDVTTPEGYHKVYGGGGNEELALAHQDQLDALFQERIVAVRNALRELGWEGENMGTLSKGGATLDPKFWHVGAGANIAGVVYTVTGNVTAGADDGVRDDLSVTPEELAAEIDGFVRKAAPEPAAEGEGAAVGPDEFEHAGMRIYKTEVRGHGTRWAVQLRDEPGVGDTLWKTPEEAKAEAERWSKQEAIRAERNAERAAAKDAEEKAKAERDADDMNGYLADKTEVQKGAIRKALDKSLRWNSQIISYRRYIETRFADGDLKVSVETEGRIKPLSRTAHFRATNEEQAAHEKRMKTAGTKEVYYVNGNDLGVQAGRYAAFLLAGAAAAGSDESEAVASAPALADATPEFTEWLAAAAVPFAGHEAGPVPMVEAIESAARDAGGSVAWGADLFAAMDSVTLDAASYQYEFNKSLAAPMYNERVKLPKYNGPVSVTMAHGGRDGAKVLAELAPAMMPGQHQRFAADHKRAAEQNRREWDEVANAAAMALWGRKLRATDYRISAIVTDEFDTETKDKLRELAQSKTAHERIAAAHEAAYKRRGAKLDAAADVLAGMATAKSVAAGVTLDDASHAIATLLNALDTVEHNEPIHRAEGSIAQADLEVEAAASFRAALDTLGAPAPAAAPVLDEADEDEDEGEDFNEDAEWEATPEDEDEEAALDGDFKGHPFRGNQYRKGSRTSGTAVSASIHAKKVARGGSAREVRNAHRIAHHTHVAASLAVTTRNAGRYHRKMARLHAKHAGITAAMDAVETLDGVGDMHATAVLRNGAGADVGMVLIYQDGSAGVRDAKGNRVTPVSENIPQATEAVEGLLQGRTFNGRKEFVDAMTFLTPFLSKSQFAAMKQGAVGEEKQYFHDKAVELANTIRNMPETYGQDGKGGEAIAYLHYFRGGADWYITEKDAGGGGVENVQQQAFGLADLFGDGGESGYISIAELVAAGAELDFHWTPKTLNAIRGRDPEPDAEKATGGDDENGDDELVEAGVAAAKSSGIAKIATADYFTMDFEGDDVLVNDELRAQIEAKLGEPLVEAVIPGLEGQVTLVPASMAPAAEASEGASGKPRMAENGNDLWEAVKVAARGVPASDGSGIRYPVLAIVPGSERYQVSHDGDTISVIDEASGGIAVRDATGEEIDALHRAVYADQVQVSLPTRPGFGSDYKVRGTGEILHSPSGNAFGKPDATPEPAAEEAEAAAPLAADKALLQSVIDGTADDMLSATLADELEAAFLRHEGNAEMAGLFEQAVNAYQAAMLTATASL